MKGYGEGFEAQKGNGLGFYRYGGWRWERGEVKESFCVKYNEKVLIFLAFWVFGLVGRITYRSIKCFFGGSFVKVLCLCETSYLITLPYYPLFLVLFLSSTIVSERSNF